MAAPCLLRQPTAEHHEKAKPRTPHVLGHAWGLATQHLGCGPILCSCHRQCTALFNSLGCVEVDEPKISEVRQHQHILSLDIAMYDSMLMQVGHSVDQCLEQVTRLLLAQSAPQYPSNRLLQRGPVHKLQDKDCHARSGEEVVPLDDVRVVQRFEQLKLLAGRLDELLLSCAYDLERDLMAVAPPDSPSHDTDGACTHDLHEVIFLGKPCRFRVLVRADLVVIPRALNRKWLLPDAPQYFSG
mmetsp:Transcript_82963/g.262059  ORF Transcript_82963/g.262059 Transcript_82963/m.262059 type:complete len:242 (-) Transcript_82963:52-777(-)